MSYEKRTYTNTAEEITHVDMNRIEQGISDNDTEMTNQKNATIPGTFAAQIKAINDDLGDTELTTEADDVHGAINEHEQQINACLKNVTRTSIDINTIRNTNTEGHCINCTNVPNDITTSSDGLLIDYKCHDNTGYQEYVNYVTGNKYKRHYVSATWQPWQQITTTEKWKATSTNIVNGWNSWGNTYYPTFVRNGNLVTVCGGSIGGGTITNETIILTGIPSNYRPSSLRVATLGHNSGSKSLLTIRVDGTIRIDTSWGGSWLNTGLYDMNFSYYLV